MRKRDREQTANTAIEPVIPYYRGYTVTIDSEAKCHVILATKKTLSPASSMSFHSTFRALTDRQSDEHFAFTTSHALWPFHVWMVIKSLMSASWVFTTTRNTRHERHEILPTDLCFHHFVYQHRNTTVCKEFIFIQPVDFGSPING